MVDVTGQRQALDVDYGAGEADQDRGEGRASRAARDIPDGGGGGAAEGVRGDPVSDTTNRSDLAEAHTDMTVSEPFVSPTNTREPAMSLCLNDRSKPRSLAFKPRSVVRNRLGGPAPRRRGEILVWIGPWGRYASA